MAMMKLQGPRRQRRPKEVHFTCNMSLANFSFSFCSPLSPRWTTSFCRKGFACAGGGSSRRAATGWLEAAAQGNFLYAWRAGC